MHFLSSENLALNNSSRSKNINQLKEKLKGCTRVKVAGLDINGILRGKIISIDKFWSSVNGNGGFGFCSGLFGWDVAETGWVITGKHGNKMDGYKDILAIIDLDSYRTIPWENNIPLFLLDFYINPDEKFIGCFRGLLKNTIEKLNDKGFYPINGIEMEYYNFKGSPQDLYSPDFKLIPIAPSIGSHTLSRPHLNLDYFNDIQDKSAEMGIKIETHHIELGPGVYETSLAYTDSLKLADNAILFKDLVKQIGYRHNIIPSFMPKPIADDSGISNHIHLSLLNKDNQNLFASSDASKPYSEILEWFLAGVMEGMGSILCIMAPNINSYKRMVEDWVAPARVSWGVENRRAAVRVITPPITTSKSTRIEIRTPGSDANTALVISAILACGLYGIENQLKNPLPPLEEFEDITKYPGMAFPRNLKDSVALMDAKDSIARKVLGDEFVDIYVISRKNEIIAWEAAVTDWEVKRYLEVV